MTQLEDETIEMIKNAIVLYDDKLVKSEFLITQIKTIIKCYERDTKES